MNGPFLSIEDLQAWYHPGLPVLSGLSIELKEHEIIGLIGQNGAGKTTLLNILSGIHSMYHAGRIRLYDRPASLRSRSFRLLRYTVFAEDQSFSYFTFREYLAFVFHAYGKKQPDVSGLIRGFGLDAFTDVLMKDLSTGNRKKAYLITAFALEPELLILDEPVNGLDLESTEYLYQRIRAYKACGTVLFSSHILESITQTSDRVLLLENGQIRRNFLQKEIDAETIREVIHEKKNV